MKNVIVFTTPTCGCCKKVKDYLRQHNLSFKEIDVSSDTHAATDMVRKSGQQGVPQLWIGGRVVVGFDRPEINRLLGIKGEIHE